MNEELVQNAVRTFCIVPEVYQQAFKQMGADFPDELVQAVKSKPDEAVKMVESNNDLLNGIVSIYQKYGDQIDEAASRTGMFKEGGKLGSLLTKFQEGGKTFKIGPSKPNIWQTLFGAYRNSLPDEPGIHRRDVVVNVDPNSGAQRYTLTEDVRGNTAESIIDIPQPGDTTVSQKIASRDGMITKQYPKGSSEYRAVVDRLLRTGAPKYVNSVYSKTK